MVDARVRVHHPCPYCDISCAFPRSLLLLWCDNRRDVFVVSSPDDGELGRVVRAFRSSFHARLLLQSGKDAVLSVPDFEWAEPPSVTGLARKGAVWVLHPVVYFGGTETYRFVSPSSTKLNAFLARVRRLGDLELLSVATRSDIGDVRDLPAASVHFFEGLTDRQARSLVAAFEGGLFHVPARTSWDQVAKKEGLSRSTFGEHLRKGQLRLLTNSYALLKARARRAETPTLLPRTGAKDPVRRATLSGTQAR